RFRRRLLRADGTIEEHEVEDFAHALFRQRFGPNAPLPDTFVTARQLDPRAHLEMQAALQPYIDNAISKTINVPTDMPFEDFVRVYDLAYDKGLKGCTTFRENPVT